MTAGWIQLLAVDSSLPKMPSDPKIWAIAVLVAIFGVIQQYCLIGKHLFPLKLLDRKRICFQS